MSNSSTPPDKHPEAQWKNILRSIITAADTKLGKENPTKEQPWYNEKYAKANYRKIVTQMVDPQAAAKPAATQKYKHLENPDFNEQRAKRKNSELEKLENFRRRN